MQGDDSIEIQGVLEGYSQTSYEGDSTGLIRKLWMAVLIQAVRDAENNINTSRMRVEGRHAKAWLTAFSKDFNMVCDMAGIESKYALEKFRLYFKAKEKSTL